MKWVFGLAVLAGTALWVAANEPLVSTQTVYFGMCDASAAVALDTNTFLVANDEDNPIRVFTAHQGGPPIGAHDFTAFLRLDRREPEVDLEAATWLGDRIYWISSHGRNKDGEFRASRHRFFATELRLVGSRRQLVPVGQPYETLVPDLLGDSRLLEFDLASASRKAPKIAGALNIEGLSQTPEGHLLIGFRNPIPGGRALLVPLLNPAEVIGGRPSRFGDPILLNLDGRGIRDITLWRGHYVIVAGSYDGRGKSALYLWAGGSAQPKGIPGLKFGDFNPEAVLAYPDERESVQLLSDDGTRPIGRKECKKVDPQLRRFRGVWLTLPKP